MNTDPNDIDAELNELLDKRSSLIAELRRADEVNSPSAGFNAALRRRFEAELKDAAGGGASRNVAARRWIRLSPIALAAAAILAIVLILPGVFDGGKKTTGGGGG